MAKNDEQKPHYPMVLIIWDDHQSSSDTWYDDKEEMIAALGKKTFVHSVGWLCHEDERCYFVASSTIPDDGRMTMVMQILKATVISKEVLCS